VNDAALRRAAPGRLRDMLCAWGKSLESVAEETVDYLGDNASYSLLLLAVLCRTRRRCSTPTPVLGISLQQHRSIQQPVWTSWCGQQCLVFILHIYKPVPSQLQTSSHLLLGLPVSIESRHVGACVGRLKGEGANATARRRWVSTQGGVHVRTVPGRAHVRT